MTVLDPMSLTVRRFKSWARNRLDLQLQELLATIVLT
jgi:hypothetical protein